MIRRRDALDDYARLLERGTPERRLLDRVPWVLDTHQQPAHELVRALPSEARRLAELEPAPLFSIITPLKDTPPRLLEETLASCRLQSWQRWELLLVDDGSARRAHLPLARDMARRDPRLRLLELPRAEGISAARNAALELAEGDHVLLLDHDDLLHPSALGLFATRLAMDPGLDLVFANEAKIDEGSRELSEFLSKPELDPFTLLRVNYVAHGLVVRRETLDALKAREGEVFRGRFDGAEDHDLLVRLATAAPAPRTEHLPLFLYYWRRAATSTARSLAAKPEAMVRAEEMLREHLARRFGQDGFELDPPGSPRGNTRFSVRPRIPAGAPPTLGVILPFRDEVEVTLRALEALERQDCTVDVRVVLVDNGSTRPGTASALEGWLARPRRRSYQLVRDPGAFNFARINNEAVRAHALDRDLLLFLNNDVELVSRDAVEVMAAHLLREPGCGFVGLRLLYPDRTEVQHGGVVVCGGFTGAGYYSIDHARGAREFVTDEHVALAVTFACAMTRRETFERLGGLDARLFPNGFGDVDISLRALSLGLRNHYFGTLEGVHHEGFTRGRTCEDAEIAALHERHAAVLARWRLRQLAYDLQPRWAARTGGVERGGLPLRYRLVDRLNDALRGALGGWHSRLRDRLDRRAPG
ncbi:MAG: glycosyltransferase [Planctomycetes bacterium]|nr:glycosyltransferase [Planctomycetota bacterium]